MPISGTQYHGNCVTAVIAAPTDVRTRRLSVSAVEVTWDPPALHGVAGYRVEYSSVTHDHHAGRQRRPRFLDTGPYTVAQVSRRNSKLVSK